MSRLVPHRRSVSPAAAALAVVALALLGACGGGDDSGSAADQPPSAHECVERFVTLANSAEVKAAVTSEDGSKLDSLFADLDDECGKQLDGLSDADGTAMVDRIDPAVVEYIGRSAAEPFEATGQSLGG